MSWFAKYGHQDGASGATMEDGPVSDENPAVVEVQPVVIEENLVVTEEPVIAEKPALVDETPVVVEEKPVVEERPSAVDEKPVVEQKPVVVEEKSMILEDKPTVVDEKPVNIEETPVVVEEKPAAVEEKPVIVDAKTEHPLASLPTSAAEVAPVVSPPNNSDDEVYCPSRLNDLLFTHFLVLGLNRTDSSAADKLSSGSTHFPGTSYDPSILYQYPPTYPKDQVILNSIANARLGRFAFTEGVPVRAVRVKLSSDSESPTEYEQLKSGDGYLRSPSVHVFRLFGDDTGIMYGLCLTFDDLLDSQLTFVGGSALASPPPKTGKPVLAAPRCYCILTHHPIFPFLLDMLVSLVKLESRARHDPSAGPMGDAELLKVLRAAHRLAVPGPGSSISLRLARGLHPGDVIQFTREPGQSYDDLLAHWALVTLFSTVSLEHILALFAALLTERQVIVVCSNASVISSLVLAIPPLMAPLVWQGLLIPVLPRNLQDMLMAPVPFVVGCRRMPSPDKTPSDVVVLDIDRNRIFVTAGGAGSGTGAHSSISDSESGVATGAVPALPEAAKLKHNVRKEYAQLRSLLTQRQKSSGEVPLQGIHAYSPSREEKATAFRILDAWQKYLNWLLAKVIGFFQASKIDVSDMRARDRVMRGFVQGVTGQNRDFVKQFTATQFLSDFITKSLREDANA